MAKKDTKFIRAAHIKRHTEGTSNELSFSVLDSLKNAADAEEGKDVKAEKPRFGGVALFSLPVRKKTVVTPTKDDVLPLTGAAPQVDNSTSFITPAVLGGGIPNEKPVGIKTSVAVVSKPGSATSTLPAPSAPVPKRAPSSSYKPPVDEIAARKARRRRSRVIATVLGSLVVIGLVGGLGYFLVTEFQNHQSQMSVLDQSIDLIAKADEVIKPLDTLVNEPLDDTAAAEIEDINAKLPEALAKLTQAKSLATQASDGMRDSTDKEAAQRAFASAEARQDMVAVGEQLLAADLLAKSAGEQLKQAWEVMLEADKLSRDAAAMVTDTTNENVTASKDKTNEAIAQFNEALYLINEVATNYPDADVQLYQDYINKRIEALNHALASDEAILVQNKQVADDENSAYNLADEEAATMAHDFPDNPAQPVLTAYETNTADLREQYAQARTKAKAADAVLGDYLGTRNK